MLGRSTLNAGDRGYILVFVVFVLLVTAVVALGLNRRAGLQAQMAGNQTRRLQTYLAQLACIEEAIWNLKQDPLWRPGRYTDLNFGTGGSHDTIATASGDFAAAGFAPGDPIAIMNSAPANDGFYTVLAVLENTLEVASGSLKPGGLGMGIATIGKLSSGARTYTDLTFAAGENCGRDTIVTASGNFAADGFRRGELITVLHSSPLNDGTYCILNDVSQTPNKIEVAHGLLSNEGAGTAAIGLLRGELFTFDGKGYTRKLWKTWVCDAGDFLSLSCALPGESAAAVTDTIKLQAWNDFYIADSNNHRIRKVEMGANKISTLAGNSDPSSMQNPFGVWVDAWRNIYIADTARHVIRKIEAATGSIEVVAGDGSQGYAGDDGVATAARLNKPYSVTVDSFKNIYIADTDNSRVRKVEGATGVITTVAGNGSAGYTEDNVVATTTRINKPQGVAADPSGTFYIADTGNNRVRKVDGATGIITTVAGDGSAGYWGDATPPTSAQIQAAQNVRVDGVGNLFIADTANHRVRKVAAEVDADTGFRLITTVAGNGSGAYAGDGGPATEASIRTPYDTWVDAGGNIYIADTDNNRIRKVDGASGVITTVAGGGNPTDGLGDGGPATAAVLNKPRGIFLDGDENIYIADDGHHRIRKVDAVSGLITTVAGNGIQGYAGDGGPAVNAQLNHPWGMHLDAQGNIYIADRDNKRVRKVDAVTQIIDTVAGNGSGTYLGDGIGATSNGLDKPRSVCVDGAGNLFIADSENHCIRKVDGASQIITTVAGNGAEGYLGDDVPATSTRLDHPGGVQVDGQGNIYIADSDSKRIRKVDAVTEIISTVVGTGSGGYWGDASPAAGAKLNQPKGVCVDGVGNVYIADNGNRRIRKVHASKGIITTVAGNGEATYGGDGGPATSASLRNPLGVQLDTAGNIYIADTDNHRIRKVDAVTGIITTAVGNGTAGYSGDGGPPTEASLKEPGDVCVDDAGNIIVADTLNNVIREVFVGSSVISTIAGEISGGFTGDGIPAINTRLNFAGDISRDAIGNYIIADTQNNRVRKVDVETGIITTVAGNGLRAYAGDGGLAAEASLDQPRDAVADASGNIFIADSENSVIRRADHETGIITTVAGTGDIGYSGDGGPATLAKLRKPGGVFVDAFGNLFIADSENSIVRKVDHETEIISTVAGIPGSAGYAGDGGPATLAKLRKPRDVWVDTFGNLFIADTENHRIRRVDTETETITTVAGNGSSGYAGDTGQATSAKLDKPGGVSVDSAGHIFIADTANHVIRKVDAQTGIIRRVAGRADDPGFAGDGGKPTDAKLNFPTGVWTDAGSSESGIVRP